MHAIHFSKMHGLGNDFVVIHSIVQPLQLTTAIIQSLANRYTGIGFDQLLLIEASSKADFACRIFNSDGSEAEQCGNGLRCVGRFLREKNLTSKIRFTIETKDGIFDIAIKNENLIQVTLGKPCFLPERIPFLTNTIEKTYRLHIDNVKAPIEFSALSMGNPHVVIRVSALQNYPVRAIGEKVANHPLFPLKTNVGFMEILNRKQIRLRTFERGVGETFACGSNACAAVVAGINNNLLDNQVTVILEHGELSIQWQGGDSSVRMTGPAVSVFDGVTALEL